MLQLLLLFLVNFFVLILQSSLNSWDNYVTYFYYVPSFSVQFSLSVMSNSLQPHGLQPTRLPCPSPTPRACSNSCALSQWCHPTILSSIAPLLLPSIFPSISIFSNESVLHIRYQSIGASASASVLPVNIQDWFPLGLTGLISLQSKGLSRVFSNTTVQKQHSAFFTVQLSHPYMTTGKTIALTRLDGPFLAK